jgi:hypothetical protein
MEFDNSRRSLRYQKVLNSFIRRSMIAKLPGGKTKFMGDNLEIVCLFQAAEI